MGYKLKRILIYPDGVTEKQVRPKKLYEYSYDFRGKTAAQVQTDGWTLGSGVSFDSNGLYSSNWNVTTKSIGQNITTAKKIILTCGLYNIAGTNSVFGIRKSDTTHSTANYLDGSGQNANECTANGTSLGNYTGQRSSGVSSWTYELDLENLTYKLLFGTTLVKSGTLTQAQADGIKANCDTFRIQIQYGTGRIQYVKIEVSL